MEENLNRQNYNEGLVDPQDMGTSVDISVISVDLDELNKEQPTVKFKQSDDWGTKELDEVYERSRADVQSSMNSPASLSVLKSSSLSSLEKVVYHHDEPTRCRKIVIRLSHFILVMYALALFVTSFHLSRQDITQLVGQSVPQVTIGFGILTLFILGLGIVANRRYWICGFNVQALCLIFLALAEIFVISACVFSEYEIFYQSNIYWSKLSDFGKARIMANWECCGWSSTCGSSDESSIYHEYRYYQGSLCLDATGSDTRNWMLDVTVIFGTFTLFDILYVIFIIACQAKWLKRKRQEKITAGATEKWNLTMMSSRSSFMSWRKSLSSISPRRLRQSIRFSRASISPKFRNQFSFRRNKRNIDMMASESHVPRSQDI